MLALSLGHSAGLPFTKLAQYRPSVGNCETWYVYIQSFILISFVFTIVLLKFAKERGVWLSLMELLILDLVYLFTLFVILKWRTCSIIFKNTEQTFSVMNKQSSSAR